MRGPVTEDEEEFLVDGHLLLFVFYAHSLLGSHYATCVESDASDEDGVPPGSVAKELVRVIISLGLWLGLRFELRLALGMTVTSQGCCSVHVWL